jgi:hypothetical protein
MAIKYKKFAPTEYVMKIKKGKIIEKGAGLSFFYNTMTTGMLVMPATALDLSFAFEDIMTNDFQSVNIQGDITYIINNYEKASSMVDFNYKEKTYSQTLANAKLNMAKIMTNLAKVTATKFISAKNVRETLKSSEELATFLKENMKDNETLNEYGLQVVSVSILNICTTAETRRALEASTREEILKQQDDAIYKRRNSAIEQERTVKENELNTEIKVAEKEKQKKEKEMETRKLVQEKQAELDNRRILSNIELEKRNAELVTLETENEKKKSDAKAYDSEVLLNTFKGIDAELLKALVLSGMDSKSLIAKAFVEIGNKADKIGTLNVSPELLETLSAK